MNLILLICALVNFISADLIGWHRQYAISHKSRKSNHQSHRSSYQDALLKHMLANGDTENAMRLIAFLHSKNQY